MDEEFEEVGQGEVIIMDRGAPMLLKKKPRQRSHNKLLWLMMEVQLLQLRSKLEMHFAKGTAQPEGVGLMGVELAAEGVAGVAPASVQSWYHIEEEGDPQLPARQAPALCYVLVLPSLYQDSRCKLPAGPHHQHRLQHRGHNHLGRESWRNLQQQIYQLAFTRTSKIANMSVSCAQMKCCRTPRFGLAPFVGP